MPKTLKSRPALEATATLTAQACWSLADLMARNGVTQAQLAKRLGSTQQTVSRALGGGGISLRTLARLAHALGYSVELNFRPMERQP